MEDQKTNNKPTDPAATQAPLTSVYTNNLPAILDHFGISLAVSTYQAGKVILVRSDGGGINTHFRDFNKPMGLAVDGQRLTVGGQNTVWYYRNMPAVAPKLAPPGRHDAAYLPRQIHVTGDIDIHELAWGKDDLWIVNTRFGCLCTLDSDHSFTPRWRPHFVSGLAPEDRCHLNGLAMVGGQPKYVTALGETDTPGGWRANKRSGGVLMDVERNEVLLAGLSMPHSPRLWAGRLWLLESGQGSLAYADLPNQTWHTVATLPGFTRGIDFAGPLAFIGLSQVRETAVFSGIPLVERLDERICGVWVVNVETGETVAFLRFETGVQEIFAVQIVPARYPEMLEFGDEILNHSYVLPDAAMKDVPAVLQEPQPAAGPPQPAGFVEEINQGAALLDQDKVEEAMAHFERAQGHRAGAGRGLQQPGQRGHGREPAARRSGALRTRHPPRPRHGRRAHEPGHGPAQAGRPAGRLPRVRVALADAAVQPVHAAAPALGRLAAARQDAAGAHRAGRGRRHPVHPLRQAGAANGWARCC